MLSAGAGAEAVISGALEIGSGAAVALPSESDLARSLDDDQARIRPPTTHLYHLLPHNAPTAYQNMFINKQVLELLLDGAEDGGFPASEAQVLASFEALLQGLEGAEDPPAVLQVWNP